MPIPKIIHYCWFGGNNLPKSATKCIKSWKKYCPDYEIKMWSEKDFDLSINTYTQEAYEQKAYGFVPDYLRLWIVYNYGGIYLDTDVQIIKSFDPLLVHRAFAGMEAPDRVALGLGFGAEAHDPLLREHMAMYDGLHFVNEDGSLNRVPSPSYSTQLFESHGFIKGDISVQTVGTFHIYPMEYFAPKCFETGLTVLTPNTYSIHQFDSSWFTEEEQAHKLEVWRECKIKNLREQREQKRRARQLRLRLAIRNIMGDSAYEKLKRTVKGE